MRFSSRALLFCGGLFSDASFRASRDAVNGDGALRRSSNGRAFVYRSTIRPVVHPPSTMRSKRVPERERWKFVAQVCRSMWAQSPRMPVRASSRSKSLRTALPVRARPRQSVNSASSCPSSPLRWSAMYESSAVRVSMGRLTSRGWTALVVAALTCRRRSLRSTSPRRSPASSSLRRPQPRSVPHLVVGERVPALVLHLRHAHEPELD
jgi:hypothetical protein